MHLNFPRCLLTCFLALFIINAQAQKAVIIPKGIKLLPDSLLAGVLITSLNAFLYQNDGPIKENKYALRDHFPETAVLLEEIKSASQNVALKVNNYYAASLTNVTTLADGDILVQLAYMSNAGNIPVLHAAYRMMAKFQDGCFYFYSPLLRETSAWKTQKVGYITCHYKEVLNMADVKAYQQTLDFYNAKLQANQLPVELYYCSDFPEVLQILGVDYQAGYAGIKSNIVTASENGTNLMVNGWYDTPHRFDPHDLFHDRLRAVMKAEIINRPVDEGCAYLYGGSWGYTWPEIKARFKNYLNATPNPDWLTLYTGTSNFEAGQKPLKVGYVLNALIAQKLEKEKGFQAVMELLGCGKREVGDANYFNTLEKLTGINKTNFNTRMSELVKGAF